MIIHCVCARMQMCAKKFHDRKLRVSRSMTNDVPNEGWTSMSVLKSRRDFNYSSVWLTAWPSVKTWTEVNYRDDVLSPYLVVYVATENGRLSKVIIILIWRSGGEQKKKEVSTLLDWRYFPSTTRRRVRSEVKVFWFITLTWAVSNCALSKNKESRSSNTVNCIIIPSFIHFFFLNQPPFGYSFQCSERMATPINASVLLGGITTHSCTGRELFYSGSQLLGVYLSFVITIQ